MDLQNIFDVFGTQIKTESTDLTSLRNEFGERINNLRFEFDNSNNYVNLRNELESKISDLKNELKDETNQELIDVKIGDLKTEFENKIIALKNELKNEEKQDVVDIKIIALQNEFQGKIIGMKEEFNVAAEKVFKKLMRKIEKADKITDAMNVQQNYISLGNKKRIVGVRPSIDKHDVVIKEQVEKPIKLAENIDIVDSKDPNIKNSLDVKGRRISSVSKGIYPFDVIVNAQLSDHIKTFDEFKRHVKDSVNELYENVDDISKSFNKFKTDVDKTFENIDSRFNGLD